MSSESLRRMTPADLEMVLRWRNHPDIRRWMYTTHEITLEEHQRWFESATHDSSKHLLIYERDGSAVGFVNISLLKGTDVAEWGFYLAPEAPSGIGTDFGRAVIRHAFETLGLYKLSGHALATNERSIRFHQRLGFRDEGVRRDHHLATDGMRHSVACFGLLRHEWQAAPLS
ncbi:MAG: hypothetical protein RIT40_1497 [Planctomycetota bacterium]|jgi:UDP-4-amino-4,6-dideoxy-N-acetyl-beta-L-altrosamine N-acetyltransferase